MDGNWEIVIGTISGFIIAFLAEPAKSWIQRRLERKRLRNMLYQETIDNYKIIQTKLPNLASPELMAITKFRLQTEGYEYAKNNNISLFYELQEASCFNHLYSICKQLQNINKKTSKDVEQLMDDYFRLFTYFVKTNALDEKILDKLSRENDTKTIYEWTG